VVQGDWSSQAQHDDVTISRKFSSPYNTIPHKQYTLRNPSRCLRCPSRYRTPRPHFRHASNPRPKPNRPNHNAATPALRNSNKKLRDRDKIHALKSSVASRPDHRIAAATFAPQPHAWQDQPSRIDVNLASCARIRAP
jgi:hypothetical protein